MDEGHGHVRARTKPCVVLVTGASGFLGQHVIGLLQTHAHHVTEIRTLDVMDYVNRLEYTERVLVNQHIGNINDLDLVLRACEGVDCVMHIAGIVDARMFQNRKLLEEVNVKGTETILKACSQQGVRRFIYCSTIDVVLGYHDIIDGTEDTTSKPDTFFFQDYASTKCEAEELVLKANGEHMTTVSIRPPTMYGEGDNHAITVALNMAKTTRSYFRFYPDDARHQQTYGGNAAWMFICAEKTMFESSGKELKSKNTDTVGGNAFFAIDDTPVQGFMESLKPFYEGCGFRQFPFRLPLNCLIVIMYFVYYVLLVVRLVFDVNVAVGPSALHYQKFNIYFKNDKAKRMLGYVPLFSYDDAMKRSMTYYKKNVAQ